VATCPRWTFCEQGFDFHGTVANEEITLWVVPSSVMIHARHPM
jgi:hypothetical protein